MPAQLWCTGPAHFYIGAGGGASPTPLYFGTTETTPFINWGPQYEDVINDIGGRVPVDKCYQGKRSIVRGDFTRWDYAILNSFQIINPNTGVAPGEDAIGTIGTLMATEFAAPALWVVYPYATKTAFTGMPVGYKFGQAIIEQDSIPQSGTKPHKISLVWEIIRSYRSPSGNASSNIGRISNTQTPGAFLLYEENITGLPGVD